MSNKNTRRVVITGYGIVCAIGTNRDQVTKSLRDGTSGIEFQSDYRDHGFRSHIAGQIDVAGYKDREGTIDRRVKRFMGPSAVQTHIAADEAIAQAQLTREYIASNDRVGLVAGSGGPVTDAMHLGWKQMEERNNTKIMGPLLVPKVMSSTQSAILATAYGIRGINYTISSACTTSLHCVGHGAELISMNKQDIILAGGGEEIHWTLSCFFDAMGALSSNFNDRPHAASRPYDRDRDGFVISGGSGMVVLEELEHARARGANILAEVVGYGANSDGHNMVAPSGEGAERCMKIALEGNDMPIDYLNTHGTSTPVGDIVELDAVRRVFKDDLPKVSATKSLTGHSLGAAGVHEIIYTLLMMKHGFISGSANIENLDDGAKDYPIVREAQDADIRQAISNSFGFGGTNGTMVLRRPDCME